MDWCRRSRGGAEHAAVGSQSILGVTLAARAQFHDIEAQISTLAEFGAGEARLGVLKAAKQGRRARWFYIAQRGSQVCDIKSGAEFDNQDVSFA